MPFDGRVALVIRDDLELALLECGFETVDPAALDAHKAAEIEKHPAGWLYRHRSAIQVTSVALLIAGAVAAFAMASAQHEGFSLLVALVPLCFIIALSTVPVRGPAFWREQAIYDLSVVHPAVQRAAQRLQDLLPEVRYILGELIQDRTMLDPYLIAEYRNERVVLGIWEGERLIAPPM